LKLHVFTVLLLLAAVPVFASWECEWNEKSGVDPYSAEELDRALAEETSCGKIAALALIRLYQGNFSGKTGSDCVFYPSCSRYGFYAVKKFGLIKGTIMSDERIFRCHEWSYTAGYPVDYEHMLLSDPVESNDTFNFIFDWLNF
jgi:putative membrane protein insertion efficiency factor